MEPLNDDELNRILREWKAPAPPSLREKIAPQQPWWRWLLTGSVRVPVPVGIAALAALAAALYWSSVKPAEIPPNSPQTLADFEPVKKLEPKIVRSSHEEN